MPATQRYYDDAPGNRVVPGQRHSRRQLSPKPSRVKLMSLTHDISGLRSTRSVRLAAPYPYGGADAADGGATRAASDEIRGRLRALAAAVRRRPLRSRARASGPCAAGGIGTKAKTLWASSIDGSARRPPGGCRSTRCARCCPSIASATAGSPPSTSTTTFASSTVSRSATPGPGSGCKTPAWSAPLVVDAGLCRPAITAPPLWTESVTGRAGRQASPLRAAWSVPRPGRLPHGR